VDILAEVGPLYRLRISFNGKKQNYWRSEEMMVLEAFSNLQPTRFNFTFD